MKGKQRWKEEAYSIPSVIRCLDVLTLVERRSRRTATWSWRSKRSNVAVFSKIIELTRESCMLLYRESERQCVEVSGRGRVAVFRLFVHVDLSTSVSAGL